MSENTYYGREEDVETSETHVDNLRAHEAATSAVEVWAKESLVGMYDKTLELWNAAAERGDTETQNGLTELYKGAEHMQQNLLHTNTAIKSVLETAKALRQQKEKIEGEYTTLIEAIDNVDADDDRLSSLIEMIESDAYEMAAEAYYSDPPEPDSSDYDNIVSDVYTTLRKLSPGTSYFTAERFFASLKGDFAMNDIQRGLLLSLLNTFVDEAKLK